MNSGNLDIYRKYYPEPQRRDPLSLVDNLVNSDPIVQDPGNLFSPIPEEIEVPSILIPPEPNEEHFLFVGGYYLPLSKSEGHSLLKILNFRF